MTSPQKWGRGLLKGFVGERPRERSNERYNGLTDQVCFVGFNKCDKEFEIATLRIEMGAAVTDPKTKDLRFFQIT